MNKKRWTGQEIEILISNWDNSISINQNIKQISTLLPQRTLDAIKRELYDFKKRRVIIFQEGKLRAL